MDSAAMINSRVKYLEETERQFLLKIIENLMPDDIATEEDLRDIAKAREEYERGETVSFDDIDWD